MKCVNPEHGDFLARKLVAEFNRKYCPSCTGAILQLAMEYLLYTADSAESFEAHKKMIIESFAELKYVPQPDKIQ